MNKLCMGFLFLILSASLVFAAGTQSGADSAGAGEDNGSNDSSSQQGIEVNTQLSTQNQGAETNLQNQIRVQTGTYSNQAGERMQIQAGESNEVKLMAGNSEAKTNMVMTQEQTQTGTKLQVQLSNGKNAEVKVMPNTASQKAMQVLGAKCEERNCTIELKEVGSGEQVRAAYEIKTQKQARILGLFQAKMQVQAQVDAETGEVIQKSKPWWAFLASESE